MIEPPLMRKYENQIGTISPSFSLFLVLLAKAVNLDPFKDKINVSVFNFLN